jgi:hypothetical protein
LINLLRASTTNKKRKGERGHPRRRPCDDLKNLDEDPFIRTTKEALCKHPMIQFTMGRFMPNCNKTKCGNVQFTLSYAFDRSNLKIVALRFLFLTV